MKNYEPRTPAADMNETKSCNNCGTEISKEYCEDYPEVCEHWTPKKSITNADRIRAMSDEELAEWLLAVLWCRVGKNAPISVMAGYDEWLAWLKSPAEEA